MPATLPTKTAGSIGEALTDTRTAVANEWNAVHLERIKNLLIELSTEIGLTDGSTVGSILEAIEATDGAVTDDMLAALSLSSLVIRTSGGTYTGIKIKLAAGGAPTATDDTTLGYQIGSIWATSAGAVYVALTVTEAAAVWAPVGVNADNVLAALAAASASVSVNSQKITNLGAPSADADAATKEYADDAAAGAGLAAENAALIKTVRVATIVAGTLATSFENGDTVDGVVLASGDRILLKNQAAPAENGIYGINGSGAPTRWAGFDSDTEIRGSLIVVREGTQAGQFWLNTNATAITVGTTALTFAAPIWPGGSAALPGGRFADNSGLFQPSGGVVSVSSAGTRTWNFAGYLLTGESDGSSILQPGSGTISNVGHGYVLDPNTGHRRTAADTQAMVCGGVDVLVATSTKVEPGADNTVALGAAGKRFTTLYSAALNTGDLVMQDPINPDGAHLVLIEGDETLTVLDVKAGKVFKVPLVEVPGTREEHDKIAAERARAARDRQEAADEPEKDRAIAAAMAAEHAAEAVRLTRK